MQVFPGKSLTLLVEFEVGGEPVAPSTAAYVVRDRLGVVQSETAIAVDGDQTTAYVTIPQGTNTLASGDKYHQMRMEVSFNADGAVFERDYHYFVVPDLFLSFNGVVARQVLGVTSNELPAEPDYYRAYVDLASSAIGEDFYNAVTGSNLADAMVARNLILYAACLAALPVLQLTVVKSIESETSKISRFAFDYSGIKEELEAKYAYYYLQIQLMGAPSGSPTLLITDSPTDAITGA